MDEDLKKLLEENLKLSKENHGMLKSIKRHFLWQKIISLIYLVLIVGPIIWSIIYLPAIMKPYIAQYKELLGGDSGALQIDPEILKNLNLDKLLNDKKK